MSVAPDFWRPLAPALAAAGKEGRPCFLCLAGNSGCGKSVLGKALRKHGLLHLRPREVLVIDDGVASVPFLGVLRRRVRFASKQKDRLQPFRKYFEDKKLVVYVNSQPARRLDDCDILVEVRCAEDVRVERLRRRNADGARRAANTADYRLAKPRARHHFVIDDDGQALVLREGVA